MYFHWPSVTHEFAWCSTQYKSHETLSLAEAWLSELLENFSMKYYCSSIKRISDFVIRYNTDCNPKYINDPELVIKLQYPKPMQGEVYNDLSMINDLWQWSLLCKSSNKNDTFLSALTSLSRRKHIHVLLYYCFITYHLPWTWPFLTFSVQVDCILQSSKDKPWHKHAKVNCRTMKNTIQTLSLCLVVSIINFLSLLLIFIAYK